MSELTPGFIVAHSHRLEELTDLVVQITGNYPLAPLQQEIMLVQSNGIAQWLKIHLAEAAGIAAMIDVTLPARFQWRAYRAVLGQQLPKTSPFDKDRLTWRLLRLLPELIEQPEFASLKGYMANDSDGQRCYQLSERLADLYDQYQMYRADWLADWAQGGAVAAPANQQWQPLLWRALLADVGAQKWNNRAELQQEFIQRACQLTPANRPEELPARVIIFGISSLPQQVLELLDALKGCMQIVLCVHNPCQYHWADIIAGRDLLRQLDIQQQRQPHKTGMQVDLGDDELHAQAHPLLAAWGKQGRDYIRLLDCFDETRIKLQHFNEVAFDLFEQAEPTHILGEVQTDILNLRSLPEIISEQRNWAGSDHSIQVHNCHSMQREVEVLHDQLLAALSRDPALQPRDIMVMVPDVDAYAPHIEAVFGRLQKHDQRYIPFTIADQGQRHQQPLFIALEAILSLPQQRFRASDVIDLLQVPAIQAKFDLLEADQSLLQRWIEGAEIRWGLDAKHRQQLGLPGNDGRNSWLFGLRRMLLGYATGKPEHPTDSAWCGDEPYSEVAGLQAEMAGSLAELLRHIEQLYEQLLANQTAAQWRDLLQHLLTQFFAATNDEETLLLQRLQQHLQSWYEATEAAEFSAPIPLQVMRESWLSRLDASSLQQRFLAGSVNFATLMPMRAIPFKYVCLLGLNDGDYPRTQKPIDFDLMAADYRPGDRSRRDDDRYLFLEALLSAREVLYLSWCGRNIRDNSEQPPSVLLSQLLEHLQQGWSGATERVLSHPLQPFDRRYFERSEAQLGQLFTFHHEWQNLHQPRTGSHTLQLAQWVPELPLTLKQLRDFILEPAKLFLTLRFQVYFNSESLTVVDDEPQVLDGLENWQILNQLLQHSLIEVDRQPQVKWRDVAEPVLHQLQRSGTLPAGAAGQYLNNTMLAKLEPLMAHYSNYRELCADVLTVQNVGTRQQQGKQALEVKDQIRGVFRKHDGDLMYVHVSASKFYPLKQCRLDKWTFPLLQHCLLNAQQPVTTVVIASDGCFQLAAMSATRAEQHLQDVLAQAWKGIQQPLPAAWHAVKNPNHHLGFAELDELASISAENLRRIPYFMRCFGDADEFPYAAFNSSCHELYQPLTELLSELAEEVER